ncbi:hypothetical protein GQ457_01G055050 [Hibiscus cannabinus]
MHGVLNHDLRSFSRKDCWSLFVKHAFGDMGPNEDHDMKIIDKGILRKSNDMPSVITTHANLRYEVEAEEWNDVLNSRV